VTPYQEAPKSRFYQTICFLCQSSIYVPDASLLDRPLSIQGMAFNLLHEQLVIGAALLNYELTIKTT